MLHVINPRINIMHSANVSIPTNIHFKIAIRATHMQLCRDSKTIRDRL